MALTTNFNADPYYDDYDENKGYYRVLFRPGYALQAREVTQLQTILQKQIERHGNHLFEDGSVVLGCELNYDNEVNSLKLETSFSGSDITVSNFANGIITGGSSNARARVVSTEASTATEQPTLMFHYLNNNTFEDGETITVVGTTTQANTVSSTGASGISGSVSNGSVVSINSGVFYVGGFFVFKDAETLTLEKYSNTPSYRVGIQVTETIVSSDTDTTLLDPAQGAYNYAAQGATRYKIDLNLSKKSFSSTDPVEANADENFFQLLKISNGTKLEETKYPVYTELEKTLARRTYDESGDYTVTPFNLQLTTHQGITGRTGVSGQTSDLVGVGTDFVNDLAIGDVIYLSGNTAATATIDSISNSTFATLDGSLDTATSGQVIHFESKLSSGLEPGKAYVKGFEYENISTKYVTVDKGRDTATVNNFGLSTSYGNKMYIKNANGFFDISRHQIIDLHCVNVSSQGTGSATNISQTKIGTARIRDIDYHSSSSNTANVSHSHSDYVLYLYDVRTSNNKSGNVADVARDSTGKPWVLSTNPTSSTFELRKDVLTIGISTTGHLNSTSYLIGDGSTSNSSFGTLSVTNAAYIGATVTITSPNPEKIIGIDDNTDGIFNIALENPANTAFDAGGGGVLVTEQQNTITTTTYTRNVVDYIANSTVATLVLDSDLTDRAYFIANSTGGAVANQVTTFDVKFQVKDTKSISRDESGLRKASADVDELSKFNFLPDGITSLKETQFNKLIFPLPDQPLALANNINFTYKTVTGVDNRQTDENGKIVINLSGTDIFPVTGSPISESQAEENFIIVVENSGTDTANAVYTPVSNGQYLSFSNTDGVARNIVVTNQQAIIDCNTAGSVNVAVTYTAKRTAATGTIRTKTITAGDGNTAYNVGANTLNSQIEKGQYFVDAPTRVIGQKIELPVSDVFNIVKIVDSGDLSVDVTNTMMTTSANNITTRYALDTGQTDNYYGHSSVYLKPGQTPPSGKIVIVFDKFTHSGKGYLTVNSYPTSGYFNNGQNTFSYSNIPSYTSPVSGDSYRLSDVLDFRPYVLSNEVGTTHDVAANTDAIANSSILLPDSDTTSTLDYSYYLPRIDKLVLSRDRQFKVVRGKSATIPVAPPDDEDSMTLYTLKIPAYTFTLTDIETRYIDNKRFTMRDIGKLEKRIERLEYFTSLNILEKETAARDITSEGAIDTLFNTTGSRFKSGILVDPFAGHSIGDVTSEDYNASVHFAEKQLRPPFYYDNFRFTLDTASSNNVVKTGDLVTLPYTNTTFIDQPLTSNTTHINPFNIVNFIGAMKLDPPSDTWFDETTKPDVTTNVEGHHDNWVLSANTDESRKGFGTQWDDWSVNWSGKQINPEPNTSVSNVGSTSVGTRSTKLISQNKSKFGITSDDPVETIVKTVGNKKLDMSVVPYVRSQRVSFSAKGLKPLTNVYVYVGSTHMSANTEPAKKLVLSSANGAFREGEIVRDSANNRGIVRIASNTVSNVATLFITNISGNSGATAVSPVSSQNNRVSNSSIGFATSNVVTGLTSGANGTIGSVVANTRGILSGGFSIMQSDDNGTIAGDVDIPAGTFRTGDRLIRITDQANNELASTTTVAETFFKAKGVLQNREKLLISTREPIVRRESLGSEEIVTDTTTRQTSQTNWVNPMAQSFTVDGSTYPMGVFMRDVTLFFSAKDTYLPVTVQIRPIVNGFPSSSLILPFSEVTLNPDKVQTSSVANATSSNTTTSTTFTFDSPVYLTPDEYAIVVISNSPEYKLYTASHGDNSTGTTRKISKQPFIGSFFRPQNAGVWEAKKEEFLMFRMNRCNFTGTGGANNYAKFITHANGASGNTANVQYQTFKASGSTIEFSNTTMNIAYESFNTSNTSLGFTPFSLEQNINLTSTRQLTASTNGMFNINATMSTSNGHVSPVIDVDRLNLIVVENNVDNAGLSANDIVVTTTGAGYTNVSPTAYTATVSAPDLTTGATATTNVFVEVTMTVGSGLESANADYTVGPSNPGQFVVGEGVIVVANNASGTVTNDGGQTDNAAYGVITSQTFVGSDDSKNTATITIRTSANTSLFNSGVFTNGTCVISSSIAQDAAHTNTLATGSNTFFKVGTVSGFVANVVPVNAGSGYLTTPTITISAPSDGVNGITAVANVVGEDSARGGNINAKYISRRVTLEDGFDASDLKVIINAYKPLGTGVHVYYKVKSDEDPQDFDDKNYVLMTQETPSSVYSGAEGDIREFIYKTSTDSITYTSQNVTYDKFKTFAVKIVMTSNNATVVPKVRDMRAIALDD